MPPRAAAAAVPPLPAPAPAPFAQDTPFVIKRLVLAGRWWGAP